MMRRTVVPLALLVLLAAGASHAVLFAQAPPAPAPPPPVEAPDATPPPREPAAGGPFDADVPRRRWGGPVLRIGSDYALAAGEEIGEVFVLGGNARIEGVVRRDVVVVFGTVTIGETAEVGGSMVAVGGQVSIAPGARIDDDFVVVSGSVEAPPDFNPGGQHIVVAPELIGGRIDAIVPWITRGLLLGRPIVPDLPWVWPIVGLFFAVYLTIALLAERPVRSCATTLSQRPVTSLLVGLLVLLLIGPVLLLVTLSIIGVIVVPFLLCAMLLAWIVGKVGVARWIGLSMIPENDDGTVGSSRIGAVRSFAIGSIVLIVAYMIPALGLIAWATVGVLGLGSAVLAFLAGYRRENPTAPRQAPPPKPVTDTFAPLPPSPPAHPHAPPVTAFQETVMPNESAPHAGTAIPPDTAAAFARAAAARDLLERPHAPFKDRLAAFAIDVIVVLLSALLLDVDEGPAIFLLLIAYHVVFWTLKATTFGGIVIQLRIVRVNGDPLRFVDSLVRGIAAIFALGVAGLGALAIIKDPERQGWHDRIAGTYVVKVPREYPL